MSGILSGPGRVAIIRDSHPENIEIRAYIVAAPWTHGARATCPRCGTSVDVYADDTERPDEVARRAVRHLAQTPCTTEIGTGHLVPGDPRWLDK